MDRIQRFNSLVAMACIVALVFTLIVPPSALAKSNNATVPTGWDNVLRLRQGDLVVVKLFSNKTYRGKVERAEPNAIGVSLGKEKSSLLISKDEVQSVILIRQTKANVIGGVAIGAGVLLMSTPDLVGTLQQTSCLNGNPSTVAALDKCSNINHVALIVSGAVVTGVGAAIILFGGKPKYIYEVVAPPPVVAPVR